MNPEQMRVKIAEACGWRKDESCSAPWCWWTPEGKLSRQEGMPDYLNDLNAMHEAEKVLKIKDRYEEWLVLVCKITNWKKLVSATASKRAEAFLKTIGKWEDSPTAQPPTNKQPSTTK